MAKINVLPKHIADLIAAGEVVERPASVVKELMENSIDAGATSLTVEIKRGGITYIRITDNGCGIERADIQNAFKSHATSKILDENDLNGIGTLGFRGEALASIAAVSKVDVLTRTPDEEIGTAYKIEGSVETMMEDAGCPVGTTIVVRDLFYNTPARMKFLKKDITEGNAVAGVVDRIALSHPEVSVRFIRDDRQQLVTPGNGNLSSCTYSVFGKDFTGGLVETSYELDGIRVSGFISRPVASRSNRSMQFFFLNGRLVKSVTAQAALEQAYKNSIMVGKFPACVLNIYAPLECVDVNVHPAKTEVRFENEKRIFDAVYYAAKSALEEKDKPSKFDLTKMNLKNQTSFKADEGEQISFKKNPEFWSNELPKEWKKAEPPKPQPTKPAEAQPPKPFIPADRKPAEASAPKPAMSPVQEVAVIPAEALSVPPSPVPQSPHSTQHPEPPVQQSAQVPKEDPKLQPTLEPSAPQIPELETPDFKLIGEAFNTYILVECEGKILLIDKHAAHERMLYEQLKAENADMRSQVLLEPITVTLSKEEYSIILSNKDLLEDSGYVIDDFGSGCIVIRECPVMLIEEDLKSVIEEIAGHLLSSNAPIPEKLDWIFHNTACRAAIKGGDNTTAYELEKFVEKLLTSPEIRYCPHGRPVLIEMSRNDLEKQFGRIV